VNHYEILGIARDADAATIKEAWRAAAKRHHPDPRGGHSSAEFIAARTAYDVLRDPVRRAAYDRGEVAPPPPAFEGGLTGLFRHAAKREPTEREANGLRTLETMVKLWGALRR